MHGNENFKIGVALFEEAAQVNGGIVFRTVQRPK
jgi:hypothetical protein